MYIAAIALLLAANFNIAGRSVPSGTRVDLDIPIPAAADPATVIPITVFHGANPGPVLAISAGVHGAEYAPVLAVQRLLRLVDAKQLRGTLVVVRIAHVTAFQTATVFYNPYDRKNLARVFPGKPDGTQTERIAHALTSEVVRRVDALIDLHGGDGQSRCIRSSGSSGASSRKNSTGCRGASGWRSDSTRS